MTLDVLICTCGAEGLKRVAQMELPKVADVRYVVAWQNTEKKIVVSLPDELRRDDVKVYSTNTMGLSRNRNIAMSHSSGDICLIADDDLRYTSVQLEAVKGAFERDEALDVATFMYECDADAKIYPDRESDLRRMKKGWYVTSFEIAYRRERIGDLRFNELFGLGAPVLQAGEESLFLYSALRRGLKGRFYPIVITRHEGPTTGVRRVADPKVLMSKGAYFYVAYRWTALLRIVLNAWRESRAGRMKFAYAFRHCFAGLRYAYHMGVKG